MKKIIALAIFAVSLHAQAGDGCSANFSAMKSPIDAKSNLLKSAGKVKRDKKAKLLTQNAELQNGQKFYFETGGCAHIAYSYHFTGVKIPADHAAIFDHAIKLLESVPTVKDDNTKSSLIGYLHEGKKNIKARKGVFSLPCGDGNCFLDISQKETLAVSYDFAL